MLSASLNKTLLPSSFCERVIRTTCRDLPMSVSAVRSARGRGPWGSRPPAGCQAPWGRPCWWRSSPRRSQTWTERNVVFNDRPNCVKFPSLKCAHISLSLNPMGHSKFHSTSNHPLPATDSSRTARTPLYPPMQAPYPLCPWQVKVKVCFV